MTFEIDGDEMFEDQEILGAEDENDTNPAVEEISEDVEVNEEEISPENLTEALAEARQQADEYLDGWQRARAELANFKKRVERESSDVNQRLKVEILSKYLVVLDDLERALEDRPSDEKYEAWADGVDLIFRKMVAILENEGVSKIKAMGELFDPSFHEALSHEESVEFEEGYVIDVIQNGYQLGELVIRPALVRVAK